MFIKKYIKIAFSLLKACLNFIIFFPVTVILIPYFYLKKIRFYQLNYFLGGSTNLKVYLSRKKKQNFVYKDIIFIPDSFNIYYGKRKITNKFWIEKVTEGLILVSPKKKLIFVIFNSIIQNIYKVISILRLKRFQVNLDDFLGYFRSSKSDVENYKSINEPFINFSKNDLIKCDDEFRKINNFMNINSEQEIITFCNRDGAYKKYQLPEMDLSYHNFRNFSPDDFIDFAKDFSNKKFFLIRVGNISEKKMNFNGKNIFDYSQGNYKSDYLDIYLLLKSKFFVGTESGLDKVMNFLRKPIVLINIQLRSVEREKLKQEKKVSNQISKKKFFQFTGEDIFFIPQKLYNEKEKRFYTFTEIANSNVGLIIKDNDFKKMGVKVINNSVDEIRNVSHEMNDFLDRKLELSDDDFYLQEKFWDIFKNEFFYSENYKISPSFLRNNKELLG